MNQYNKKNMNLMCVCPIYSTGLHGNKDELYDRLKRHAYPGSGKKGAFNLFYYSIKHLK